MKKIKLIAILLLVSLFSFSQVEKDNIFRGSKEVNIYTIDFDQIGSVNKFCEYLSNDNGIPMMITGDGTQATSDSFYVNYKGHEVYSKIFVNSEIVNDTVILKITGFTNTSTWSTKPPTYMEYLNKDEDRYSRGVLYKKVMDLTKYYFYKEKVTYSK